MPRHGFVRVAAGSPVLRVADCAFNVEQILALVQQANDQQVDVLVLPELALTGYTCGDLFHQPALLSDARKALLDLAKKTEHFPGLVIVGLPLTVDDHLFNCAAAIQEGEVLGIVPKTFLPNYKEFYESRWFAPGLRSRPQEILLGDDHWTVFDRHLLLDARSHLPGLVVGMEICEDLWVPIPPSSAQALAGATLLVNLSASNEVIGKAGYRRQLVVNQSGRGAAGYVYASCGVHESTTDLVFGGHNLIAENGVLLKESKRFERDGHLLVCEIDIERLLADRWKTNSFFDNQPVEPAEILYVTWNLPHWPEERKLIRGVEAHPFAPRGGDQLRERCDEIFHTQVAGLAKRLEHIGKHEVTLGVSGGLDSTLALLVACKTLDLLGTPRQKLAGLTMPGFGTTKRTLANAQRLMRHLGIGSQEIDIRPLCFEEMKALGHRPFGIDLAGLTIETLTEKLQNLPADNRSDLVFENIQARMRTSLLMNRAFVIGTGDLSELALGWCTYNADHMSMYNPNVSIPKTLVKFLVAWAAENEFEGETRATLLDIVGTLISPELLPTSADGGIAQATEDSVGPYELVDFFLFHFLRYGASPAKILYLAQQAKFDKPYTAAEIEKWLRVFLRRFFANQFKRSCLPDGPKVGSISLSPRGDWRMPSDAAARAWLDDLQ